MPDCLIRAHVIKFICIKCQMSEIGDAWEWESYREWKMLSVDKWVQ